LDYSAAFTRKLSEYENLIRYASRRYRIRGVLEPEDLYQEGLMILDSMFHKYDFDPDSVDFRKMFKTELWHGLWHVLKLHKTQKRHHTKLHPDDYADLEKKAAHSGMSNLPGDPSVFCASSDPEESYSLVEEERVVESFVDKLVDRLDAEAQLVLNELVYPREWEEIPDYCKMTQDLMLYERVPSRIPNHVIAELLDIPIIRVRRAIRRIRTEARQLGEELGLPIFAKAGVSRRSHV